MALDYGEGGGMSVTMDGPFASSGGGGGNLKLVAISAPAANWKGGESPFSQVVAVDGVTVSSKVDVQLSMEQSMQFSDRIFAFQAINNSGVITLYAYGSMPDVDFAIQATISEVMGEGLIPGNIFAVTNPQADYNQTDSSKADFIKNKPDAAITKAQKTADAALARTGGEMTGALIVLEPASDGNPATKKYVDGVVAHTHMTAQVTLLASGWSDAAPYIQTIAVDGILAADRPHFGVVYTDNWETEKEAFSAVDELDTADGSAIFTCFEEKPGVDLTIQMEVNRGAESGGVSPMARLLLDDDESGYGVQAVMGDETYGVGNMTLNSGATDTTYDFTVL